MVRLPSTARSASGSDTAKHVSNVCADLVEESADRIQIHDVTITMFYFEDRNVAEVATLMGLPEGTVKSHLHRARRALAEMME